MQPQKRRRFYHVVLQLVYECDDGTSEVRGREEFYTTALSSKQAIHNAMCRSKYPRYCEFYFAVERLEVVSCDVTEVAPVAMR